MSEDRVHVWVCRFKDRPHLVLQWKCPETGKRKSKSAETADPDQAEIKRADLESDLNHGRHKEASRMSWERFRELFEEEFLPDKRPDTRRNYQDTFDLFERICQPAGIRSINERRISAFAAGRRKLPGRGNDNMLASTIRVRLQFLHTALQ